MIRVHQMSDEELVILWHRLNMSFTNTGYMSEIWRAKFHQDEGDVSWEMWRAISKELELRKVEPYSYYQNPSPQPTSLQIGKMNVEFAKDGASIEVGCETISYDTIHRIYTTIVDKRNEYVESQE